jgi:hypothetical protein
MSSELRDAQEAFSLSEADLRQIFRDSLRAAFRSPGTGRV